MGSFSKFVAFYNEPARYQIKDGVVSIWLRSGNDTTEMAMPLCIFARSIERGKRAIECYRAGDSCIDIDD